MFPFRYWADDNDGGGGDAYPFISQYVIVIILIPLGECHVLDKYDGKQSKQASRSVEMWTLGHVLFQEDICVMASSVISLHSRLPTKELLRRAGCRR